MTRISIEYESATVFGISSSPQYRALDWLVETDPAYICPGVNNTVNLIQRYVLGVLYFETGGDSWTSCSAGSQTGCDDDPFFSASNECLWEGILCDFDGHIRGIHLAKNNLEGTIPWELSLLVDLEEIVMDDNKLSGSIPSELGSLSALKVVDLDNNQLTGNLPSELFDATELRVLDLDTNSLDGTISTLFGQLTNLYFLQLDRNGFTGVLPTTQLGNLPNLRYLTLFSNDLSGTISGELCTKEITLYADCDVCAVQSNSDCCTTCLNS